MTRALRREYEGALYHVLSRGNEHRTIFLVDHDGAAFLSVLGEMHDRGLRRREISCLSYRFFLVPFAYHLTGGLFFLLASKSFFSMLS